jgi:hypothetical protein
MSNPTTPFSWQMPTNTDLVTDLPADFEVFGQAVATSMADLLGGTSGQILAKNSNTDMDFVWIANDQGDITGVTAGTGISGGGTSGTVTVTNSMATAIDAKGDLIAGTGADTFSRLAIGTNNQVLTADSAEATGMKWATAGGGGSYTLIASGTLSGTSTSVSSISGTYKKLIAFYDNYYVSGTDTTPRIRINTISTSTYNVQRLNPTDGTLGTARATSGFQMDEVNSGTSASNDNQVVLIIDGYASNTFHSYQINSNPTNGNQYVYFGANTSIGEPITSIQFQTQNGTTSWAGGTYAVYGVN